MKHTILIALILLSGLAQAGEIGVRFNNAITSKGLFDFDFGGAGKLFEGTYSAKPVKGRFADNFFVTGAVGRYFTADFDSPSFWVLEAAPGVRAEAGPVRVSLSQGAAFMNTSSGYFQFVTHFDISFVDQASGVSVGLERSHYSTGNSGAGAGYDLTGFVVGVHF